MAPTATEPAAQTVAIPLPEPLTPPPRQPRRLTRNDLAYVTDEAAREDFALPTVPSDADSSDDEGLSGDGVDEILRNFRNDLAFMAGSKTWHQIASTFRYRGAPELYTKAFAKWLAARIFRLAREISLGHQLPSTGREDLGADSDDADSDDGLSDYVRAVKAKYLSNARAFRLALSIVGPLWLENPRRLLEERIAAGFRPAGPGLLLDERVRGGVTDRHGYTVMPGDARYEVEKAADEASSGMKACAPPPRARAETPLSGKKRLAEAAARGGGGDALAEEPPATRARKAAADFAADV
jgi:hypothetical protein